MIKLLVGIIIVAAICASGIGVLLIVWALRELNEKRKK